MGPNCSLYSIYFYLKRDASILHVWREAKLAPCGGEEIFHLPSVPRIIFVVCDTHPSYSNSKEIGCFSKPKLLSCLSVLSKMIPPLSIRAPVSLLRAGTVAHALVVCCVLRILFQGRQPFCLQGKISKPTALSGMLVPDTWGTWERSVRS